MRFEQDAAGPGDAVEFLGLDYMPLDMDRALDWVMRALARPSFSYVVTPNVDHVVRLHRAERDADGNVLWNAYRGADLTLCDSRILALLARRSGIDLPVVAGSDLTARLLNLPLPAGTRIALVGGTPGQRDWLAAHLPQAEVHHHQPPMGLRTNNAAQEDVARFVEEVRPNLILLTVGAPQSELVADLIARRGLAQGVALCVGASIEFLTGEKRRAPRLLQTLSLEWAFRLASEPRRLWRRYLIEGPAILAIWRQWHKLRGAAHDD